MKLRIYFADGFANDISLRHSRPGDCAAEQLGEIGKISVFR